MAIRTSTSSARSSSYSTQKAPQKPSSAQRSSSTQRASTPTQNRQTSSAPRRDTFTYSSPTAKQTAPKTSTAKTSTASRSSQAKTSTAKSNTTAKASSSKTVTKAKSNPTASKAKRDSFEFSSEAVKKSVQSAKSSKSSANSKATSQNNKKNSQNKASGSLGKQTVSTPKSEKTLSEALTGKNIQGLNDYLKSLENKFGTKYVFNKFFGGDKTKYDPVKRASKIANVSVSSLEQAQNSGGTGCKKIMNAYDPTHKLKKENISKFVSFNQNGGWFDDGKAACKATSLAIVASINSGKAVKPTEVGADTEDGFLSEPRKSIPSIYDGDLNITVIENNNSIKPEEQLNKIKESLSKGEAISVQVTTKTNNQHWVVVTGTVDNCDIKDIKTINDLVGIDPWYGSCSQSSNGKVTIDKNVNATMNLGDKNKCLGNSKGYGYMTASK